MRLLCCRNLIWIAAAALGLAPVNAVNAGMFWGNNTVFGPAPVYGGYAYAPAYTTSSYYAPVWTTYSAGYAPAFSYSAYGSGFGSYAYNNGCCGCAPCGCAPCGCSSCGSGDCASGNCSGNCADGNCASGNCGAGYAPPISNGPTPEPTPSQPPAANPPSDPRKNPPVDDFRPGMPRSNDSTIPRVSPMPGVDSVPVNPGTGSGNFEPVRPSSTVPPAGNSGSTIPPANNTGGTIPNSNPNSGSSIPPASIPSTIPSRGTIPEGIPNPSNPGSAPLFDADEQFKSPTIDRSPAPTEPNGQPVLNKFPSAMNVVPAPIELGSVRVTNVQVPRQRVVMQAGFTTHSMARMEVTPRWNAEIELAHK